MHDEALQDSSKVWEPLRPTLTRWRLDPVAFVTEAFDGGIRLEAWQAEALRAIVDHDRVAIRSGHGVGKSAFLSWLILWWHVTRFPAKTACTAPTAHQLQDVLWGEIARWHRKLKDPFRDWLEITSETVTLSSAPMESFAVARTARKENPEAFQGFHSENMLFVVDEASGVEDIIFEVGSGAMSTVGAKTVMAGNPTRTSGYFHAAFHKMRDRWWTKRVSCTDSTRVSEAYPDEIAAQYGRDSNVYRVRVLGEFPTGEDDSVIPLHLVEGAVERDMAPIGVGVVWGVDVARFGDDRTALCKRQGNVILEPVRSWRGRDTMQTVGWIVEEYRNTVHKPVDIAVDVIGLGAGVVDRLRELGLPATGVNVSEAAASRDRFNRLRDDLWFRAREWFEGRDVQMPDDAELISELTGVKYATLSSGKIKVESKDDMKKRGLSSPDLADAFMLTFAANPQRQDHDDWGDWQDGGRSEAGGY